MVDDVVGGPAEDQRRCRDLRFDALEAHSCGRLRLPAGRIGRVRDPPREELVDELGRRIRCRARSRRSAAAPPRARATAPPRTTAWSPRASARSPGRPASCSRARACRPAPARRPRAPARSSRRGSPRARVRGRCPLRRAPAAHLRPSARRCTALPVCLTRRCRGCRTRRPGVGRRGPARSVPSPSARSRAPGSGAAASLRPSTPI